MTMSAQHTGLVFSPHTFLHTNEAQQQHHHVKMMVADEDEAAAALCALPSTTAHPDPKAFQHIWAQVPTSSFFPYLFSFPFSLSASIFDNLGHVSFSVFFSFEFPSVPFGDRPTAEIRFLLFFFVLRTLMKSWD